MLPILLNAWYGDVLSLIDFCKRQNREPKPYAVLTHNVEAAST